MTGDLKNIIKINREIDEVFKNIKGIAESYLSINYPEAPDPDDYIDAIEEQIKKYREVTK